MRAFFNAMNLTNEQLTDIKQAIKWYQQHNISVANPRYQEYEVILQLLDKYKETEK